MRRIGVDSLAVAPGLAAELGRLFSAYGTAAVFGAISDACHAAADCGDELGDRVAPFDRAGRQVRAALEHAALAEKRGITIADALEMLADIDTIVD